MNIFDLAITQSIKEGKHSLSDVIDKAIKIRKHYDKIDAKRAKTQFKKKA